MSLKRYCPSCFAATEYTSAIPKTCSKCEKPFTFAFASKDAQKKPLVKKIKPSYSEDDLDDTDEDEDDDFDEEIVAYMTQKYKNILRGFQIKIEGSSNDNSFKLGDILNNPSDFNDRGQR